MHDDSVDSFVDARRRRHGSIPGDVDAAISLERPSLYSPFSSFPSIAAENECQLTRAGEACGDDLYRLNRTTLLALLFPLFLVLPVPLILLQRATAAVAVAASAAAAAAAAAVAAYRPRTRIERAHGDLKAREFNNQDKNWNF